MKKLTKKQRHEIYKKAYKLLINDMKQLPYIAIEGVGKTNRERVESLIAIEPILVFIGLKSDEQWNNKVVESYIDGHLDFIQITRYTYSFHSHPITDLNFKSTEINKLIKYMIDNKFIK